MKFYHHLDCSSGRHWRSRGVTARWDLQKWNPGREVGCCWAPRPDVLDGHVHCSFLRLLSLWIAAFINSFSWVLLVHNILLKRRTCQSNKTILSKTASNLLTWWAVFLQLGCAMGSQPTKEATAHTGSLFLQRGHSTWRFKEISQIYKEVEWKILMHV